MSAFLGTPAPAAAAELNWPKIDKSPEQKNPFGYLAFLLQFAPATGPAAVEIPLRKSFARIGIEAGKPFPTVALSDADKAAMASADEPAKTTIKQKLTTLGKPVEGLIFVTSGIGDRAVYNGDWAQRAAVGGILANDPAEAAYAVTRNDSAGQLLDGAKAR